MKSLLHTLARHGDISWLSYYFSKFIADQTQDDIDSLVSLSAALVSEANQHGSVCIKLGHFQGHPLFDSSHLDASQIPRGIDCNTWCARLQDSSCVGGPGEVAPLTLEDDRLYLNRYWNYEESVASRILARLQHENSFGDVAVTRQIERLFADSNDTDEDQKLAVMTAASKHFSVISGGPGSGKTTTIMRLLSTLVSLEPESRIALVAPTGKAAARMMDSINQRIDQIAVEPAIRDKIPTSATTIHRLLGYRHHGYRYTEHHRISLDCVIVDEASMIDLKLIHHLLAALPESARLILLGDRDQLASVAAGNVLGDITGHGCSIDSDDTGVAASITLLRSNYRFARDSAIGEIASKVNQGEVNSVLKLLHHQDRGLSWYIPDGDQLHGDVLSKIYDAYDPVFSCDSPDEALKLHENIRVLCATNRGPLGIESLNRMISQTLLRRNNLPDSDLFSGLPILIHRNQSALGLFNGDSGILWQYASGLRACFRDTDGGVMDIAINRLPEFAPAWTSTVHKSQGSEFDSVILILPSDEGSGALSRELLYTAITRARRQFILHAAEPVIIRAIEKLTLRHSGLALKLGWVD